VQNHLVFHSAAFILAFNFYLWSCYQNDDTHICASLYQLRKYVMYTWGCKTLDNDYESTKQGSSCTGFMIPSIRGNGSLHGNKSSRKKLQNREDSVSFNRKVSIPSEKVILCFFYLAFKVVLDVRSPIYFCPP
jgi:hypothetical protein